MNAGRLIAFEGIDGCGKSTQVERFVRACRSPGREVVATREPTDGPFGRRIREMARSGGPVSPEVELDWFLEDRRSHVAEVIVPALESGCLVVTDRYFLSTVAYQGARGLDPAALLARNESEFPLPDLALLLELDPERALARAAARPGAAEPRFEEAAYLARVASIFASLERPYLARIDAAASCEAVGERIVQVSRQWLGLP